MDILDIRIHGQKMYVLALQYAIEMLELGATGGVDVLPQLRSKLEAEKLELDELERMSDGKDDEN